MEYLFYFWYIFLKFLNNTISLGTSSNCLLVAVSTLVFSILISWFSAHAINTFLFKVSISQLIFVLASSLSLSFSTSSSFFSSLKYSSQSSSSTIVWYVSSSFISSISDFRSSMFCLYSLIFCFKSSLSSMVSLDTSKLVPFCSEWSISFTFDISF